MLTFKVTTVGASEGFILNKEAKTRLGVQKGDTLYLTEAPDGALRFNINGGNHQPLQICLPQLCLFRCFGALQLADLLLTSRAL